MAAKEPIYKPQEEAELIRQIWSLELADNLEKFVEFVYPWGKQGTPLEHKRGPRKWQRKILRNITAHVRKNKSLLPELYEVLQLGRASGRGIGKSALLGWIVHWFMSTRVGGAVQISANGESQLEKITWPEVSKWFNLSINSHWFEVSSTKVAPAAWFSELVKRDLKIDPKAWSCDAKLWSKENPDAFAGLHNGVGILLIFDEASGIPDEIYAVSQGFWTELTPDRYWICFSNPRRNSGYFYEIFNAKRNFWDADEIDARTVEDTDKKVYQQIIDEYGADSNEARVEIYGQFPLDDDQSFINPTIVKEAQKRQPYNDDTASITMGVDPAGSGADQTVVAIRQGRDLLELVRWQGLDTMSTVGRIAELIDEHKPAICAIDCGGLGAGIVDRLKEQGYKIREVNFGWSSSDQRMYVNKRAEIWGKMREWIRTASVPEDKRLLADLTGVKSIMTSTGAIQLESKKDLRARGLPSPDSGDALALSLAFAVANREKKNILPKSRYFERGSASASWMGS